jgi:hypothetical protein
MLDESFKNFFPKDVEKKQSHAQEVFDLLQSAYSTQGGIHGDGFKSPQDMIDNVPLWKIRKNQGKVVAAAMYKDTGTGRKRVAIGTDGSEHGKKVAADIVTSDLRHDRAHMEVSGKSLSFLKKNIDLTNLAHSFDSAQEYHQNRGDTIDRPSENDPEVTRHPELADKMYSRKIGSHIHTKILLGAIGKSIKEKNGVKVS